MQYLKNNAVLKCDKGLLPNLLTVTSNNKIKNRDGLFATEKDNKGGINIQSFGLCAVAGICRLNLDLSGVSLAWVNVINKVKISGKKPLTDESKLICPKGGIISCLISGQM